MQNHWLFSSLAVVNIFPKSSDIFLFHTWCGLEARTIINRRVEASLFASITGARSLWGSSVFHRRLVFNGTGRGPRIHVSIRSAKLQLRALWVVFHTIRKRQRVRSGKARSEVALHRIVIRLRQLCIPVWKQIWKLDSRKLHTGSGPETRTFEILHNVAVPSRVSSSLSQSLYPTSCKSRRDREQQQRPWCVCLSS